MLKYNVIIIGAGPSGCYLAYKLKNKGINVLLLEKTKFPRYKACAGGLTKKAYDILLSENKDVKKIVEKKVKKGLFVRNNKFTVVESNLNLIYMTYRSDLDLFLLNMAVDNRTVFLDENISIKKINQRKNTITYSKNNKNYTLEYDILVGAWGSNLHMNKLVNLVPFERFSISSSWEGTIGFRLKEYFKEYSLCQIMNSYPGFVGYIFPKSQKITAGLFTSINHPKPFFKKMWKDFVKFWDLDINVKPRYTLIPIRNNKKSIAKNNILLVGDAGGLADPFTGEGIYYALISSSIASKHIENFFIQKNYNLASEYNNHINKEFYNLQKWAKLYERLFHYFPNFMFWFGSEVKLGNEIVNSFITGEIKYNEIKKIIKFTYHFIFKRLRIRKFK
jgi:geranylgeranyl reductase family protein